MLDVNKKISKKEFVKKLGLTTVALSVLTPLVDAKTLFKGDSINLQDLNTQQIVATDTNKELVSLDTSTYPSLTELSYVKGVTSGVQTQMNLINTDELSLTVGNTVNITTGEKARKKIKGNRQLVSWILNTRQDQVGSIIFDIKKNGVSIIGSGNKPTLTTQSEATENCTGWTSSTLSDGDVVEYWVESSTNITWINLSLTFNHI